MSTEDEEGMEILMLAGGPRKEEDRSSNEYVDIYRVNLEAGRVTKFGGDVLFDVNSSAYYTSMVALGNMIYILGGGDEPRKFNQKKKNPSIPRRTLHSKVSRINIVDFEGGWKKVNPFKAQKDFGLPFVSFNSKIYLFGGCIRNKDDGTLTNSPGEVYDPALNYWALLPEPQVTESHRVSHNHSSHVGPVWADPKNNRIIVQMNYVNSIYAYYPDKRQWVRLVHPYSMHEEIICAFFDDMLIYHIHKAALTVTNGVVSFTHFQVFDLVTKKWVDPVLSPDFDRDLLRWEYNALIPMGSTGIFCLCVYHDLEHRVLFLKFRVKRIHSGAPLFNFISYHNLCVTSAEFSNFLPIAIGSEGKMSKRKETSEEASSPVGDSRVMDELLVWTDDMEEALHHSLIEQIKLGNRVGGTFTTIAYDNVCKKLKNLFPHINMTNSKITNHFKNMT